MSATGALFNVNADTLAAHLAGRLGAPGWSSRAPRRACSTTRAARSPRSIARRSDALIASGTASAGMVAKLRACEEALERGAAEVRARSTAGIRRHVEAVLDAPPATGSRRRCRHADGGRDDDIPVPTRAA